MCTIRDGVVVGGEGSLAHHLSASRSTQGIVTELCIAERLTGLGAVNLAWCTKDQVLDTLLHLVGSLVKQVLLQILGSLVGCTSTEVGTAGSIGSGVERTAVGITTGDRHPVKRHAERLADHLSADGIQSGSQVRPTTEYLEGSISQQLGPRIGVVKSGKPAALLDHGKALADLPIRIAGNLLFAPPDHLCTLDQCLVETTGTDRHNIAFTPLSQPLENLEHVARFDLVLHGHVVVVDAKLLGKLGHAHHQCIAALWCTVALIGSGGSDIGVVGDDIKLHIVDF